MVEPEDLSETEIGILEVVYQGMKDERKKRQTDVAGKLGKDEGYISDKLDKLQGQELIRRRKVGRSNRLYLTDFGAKIYLDIISGTPESDNNLLHLHKFTVKYPIKDLQTVKENRGEDWREKYFSNSDLETVHDEINDTYRVKDALYQFTVTRRSVLVMVDDLVGNDPHRLKNRALADARKGAKWIQDMLSLQLENQFTHVSAEVPNQHMAIMNDPLSNLVNESEAVGTQVQVTDEEGNVRLWTDDSEGRKDLEAGTQHGTHGMAEEDIETVLDWYSWLIQNQETHKKFRRWLEEKFS